MIQVIAIGRNHVKDDYYIELKRNDKNGKIVIPVSEDIHNKLCGWFK